MPPSEAYLDAPRALRRVRHVGSFTDSLGGVMFVAGVAQSGMPEHVLARLRGIGLPLLDLGPWEAAPPAPEPVTAAHPALDGVDPAVVARAGELAREAEYAPGGSGTGQAAFDAYIRDHRNDPPAPAPVVAEPVALGDHLPTVALGDPSPAPPVVAVAPPDAPVALPPPAAQPAPSPSRYVPPTRRR